jgi:hypothetical protein
VRLVHKDALARETARRLFWESEFHICGRSIRKGILDE